MLCSSATLAKCQTTADVSALWTNKTVAGLLDDSLQNTRYSLALGCSQQPCARLCDGYTGNCGYDDSGRRQGAVAGRERERTQGTDASGVARVLGFNVARGALSGDEASRGKTEKAVGFATGRPETVYLQLTYPPAQAVDPNASRLSDR